MVGLVAWAMKMKVNKIWVKEKLKTIRYGVFYYRCNKNQVLDNINQNIFLKITTPSNWHHINKSNN